MKTTANRLLTGMETVTQQNFRNREKLLEFLEVALKDEFEKKYASRMKFYRNQISTLEQTITCSYEQVSNYFL